MPQRKCYKCGCSSTKDPTLGLFRFPKPGKKNMASCELWAKFAVPDTKCTLELMNKLYYQHKTLCSNHFDSSCFLDNPLRKKLRRFVIPGKKYDEKPQVFNMIGTMDWNVPNKPQTQPSLAKEITSTCSQEENNKLSLKKITMFDVRVCRGCLETESKLLKVGNTVRQYFTTITGLEACQGDGYPNYLCIRCHTYVKKALSFRRKCRRAHFVMNQIMNTKRQITLGDIAHVDRSKNNLETNLSVTPVKMDVHIRPDNVEDLEELVEDDQEDITADDFDVNNETEMDNAESGARDDSIDLEDVFKGLDDKNEKSEETEEEWFPALRTTPAPRVKRKRTWRAESPEANKEVNKQIVKALKMAKIQCLDEEQQKAVHQQRMLAPAYKAALYKCAICVAPFPALALLVEHVRSHNASRGFKSQCQVCEARFETEEQLVVHQAETHWYKYSCRACKKVHYTLNELMTCTANTSPVYKPRKRPLTARFALTSLPQQVLAATLLNHDGFTGYVCGTCNIGFKCRTTYNTHVRKHAVPSTPQFTCDICGVHYMHRSGMQRHMLAHHKYTYTCKQCRLCLTNRFQALHHMSRCSKVAERFVCEHCNKSFKRPWYLKKHRSLEHYSSSHTHHCATCARSFTSSGLLYTHQLARHRYIHIPDQRLCDPSCVCGHCGAWFVSRRVLDLHMVRHGHPEAKDVPWSCLHCKIVCSSQQEFEEHQGSCTHTRYPKKCTYCDEMLSDFRQYQSHYSKSHKGLEYVPVNQYAPTTYHVLCEQCGRTVSKYKMATHLREHEQAPARLACGVCRHASRDATRLACHVLAQHTPRPYRCALCPLAFKQRYKAKDHILKTHSPVRPFRCEACERSFAHIDHLHEHAVNAHNVRFQKCDPKARWKKAHQLIVYPHMKINASLIEPEVIAQAKLELYDYTDENRTVVDNYMDYLIFDPPDEVVRRRIKAKKQPHKSKLPKDNDKDTVDLKLVNDDEDIKKDIKDDEDILADEHQECYDESLKHEDNVEYVEDDFDESPNKDNDDKPVKEIDHESEEVDELKPNCVDENLADTIITDYDIVEYEGEEFVLINGALYKKEVD